MVLIVQLAISCQKANNFLLLSSFFEKALGWESAALLDQRVEKDVSVALLVLQLTSFRLILK